VRTSAPSDRRHTLIVLSELPETTVPPSGVIATLFTDDVW
jgi:hypothetical protein